LGGNGRSVILQTQGAAKVIAMSEEGRPGRVIGVHIVGSRVSELIAAAQLVYSWDAEPSDVAQLIPPHPTQPEASGEAHLGLAGKPLHVLAYFPQPSLSFPQPTQGVTRSCRSPYPCRSSVRASPRAPSRAG